MKSAEHSGDRIVIRGVSPELDCGRFAIKRVLGEIVVVRAEIFSDCSRPLFACVRYRQERQSEWVETPMAESGSDIWEGCFVPDQLGSFRYTISAWTNPLLDWWFTLLRLGEAKLPLDKEAAKDISVLERAVPQLQGQDRYLLEHCLQMCRATSDLRALINDAIRGPQINSAIMRFRDHITHYALALPLIVDPILARFGAWYQIFPRSCSRIPAQHGTLRDLTERLPRIADLGFDVVYIPPIHPIGHTARKGKNNNLVAAPSDPGSPWAIGTREGGHKQIHPALGTISDFEFLLNRAQELGLTIALDMALQCSPDHPYVNEHPNWFRRLPDGSIQCAEDPPNRYEDVYPFDFECEDWEALWLELKSIFTFWIDQGVNVFRVDNPHTKPFSFWEWLIRELKEQNPGLIFLSEGLTRPNNMIHLARIGFTMSYDYFPWRNTKHELVSYYSSLPEGETREFFRPILWPNTPQYLSPVLQSGGVQASMTRLILAATLCGSYGIYGPSYELCEIEANGPGSTEYIESEQYQIRSWDWSRITGITALLSVLNAIRRGNVALQSNDRLNFHPVDNDQVIAFSKTNKDYTNRLLTVVNLDPNNMQSGWVTLSLDQLGLSTDVRYAAEDLLTGERYSWFGARNYVALNTVNYPAHILRLG